MTSVNRRARAANLRMFGDGDRVRDYSADPYHQVRRELAARMLADLAPPSGGPVLEIGADPHGERPAVVADLAYDALVADRRPGRPAVCLDAEEPLPFADEAFAAILLGEVIEHLFDPLALLRECRRVLRPAGVLVLTTPNLAGLQDRLRFLLGRAPRQVDPLHPYLWLHIRPFTLSLLRRTLTAAGLDPVAAESNFVGWRTASGRWYESRMLARRLPGLGGSLIVAARRPTA